MPQHRLQYRAPYLINQRGFDVLVAQLVATGAWTEDRARTALLEVFTIYTGIE